MREGLCIGVYSDASNWNNAHAPGMLPDWLTVALPEGEMRFSPGCGRTVGLTYCSKRAWFPLHPVKLRKQLTGGPIYRWAFSRSSKQINELDSAVMCALANPCRLFCTIGSRCYWAYLEFRESCSALQVERIDVTCTSEIQKT